MTERKLKELDDSLSEQQWLPWRSKTCSINVKAFLQLCRSSSGRRVSGLCRGLCWSPRAWHRWCRRNPPPPPHASGMSQPLILRPHTGNREGETLNLLCFYSKVHSKDRYETWGQSDKQQTRDVARTYYLPYTNMLQWHLVNFWS